MSDDLTPSEREALKNLPRERMPSAGLEDRVVGALSARGVLAPSQRGRVFTLTSSRVAGVVAAGFALIIGGYAVGLWQGARDSVVPTALQQPALSEAMGDDVGTESPGTFDMAKIGETREKKAADVQPPATEAEKIERRTKPQAPARAAVENEPTAAAKTPASEEGLRSSVAASGKDDDAAAIGKVEPMQPEQKLEVRGGRTEEADKAAKTDQPPSFLKFADRPKQPAARSAAPRVDSGKAAPPQGAAPTEAISEIAEPGAVRYDQLRDRTVRLTLPENLRVIADTLSHYIFILTSDGPIWIRLPETQAKKTPEKR